MGEAGVCPGAPERAKVAAKPVGSNRWGGGLLRGGVARGGCAREAQVRPRSTFRKPSSSSGARIGSGSEVSEDKTLSEPSPDPTRRGRCGHAGAARGGAGACWPGSGVRVAARGGRSSAGPGASGGRMAEPTRLAEPGRFALRSPRCREGAVPGASAQRPKKKAFYLLRMKPLKEPAPNNNNVSFVIHCQLGKEIKHICSNCSRGEDTRDGECLGPSGRWRAREAGRWLRWSPVRGRHQLRCLENCGDFSPLPRRDTRLPGTLQSDDRSQTRTASPQRRRLKWGFEKW